MSEAPSGGVHFRRGDFGLPEPGKDEDPAIAQASILILVGFIGGPFVVDRWWILGTKAAISHNNWKVPEKRNLRQLGPRLPEAQRSAGKSLNNRLAAVLGKCIRRNEGTGCVLRGLQKIPRATRSLTQSRPLPVGAIRVHSP